MVEYDGHELTLTKGRVRTLGQERADRISEDAILRVIYEEEQRIRQVFQMARELADHAGRATVQEDDIRLAFKYMEGK